MLLKSMKLEGWRSFAPGHPAEIADLGMVNLLIGPNNVGKSNLGRFLVRLRSILHDYRDINPWHEGRNFLSPLMISFHAEEIDHWLRDGAAIHAELTIPVVALRAPDALPPMLISGDAVRFAIQMSGTGDDWRLSITPMCQDGRPMIIKDGRGHKLLLEDGTYKEQVTTEHTHRLLAHAACSLLASSVIEIRPLRDPARKSALQVDKSTDGGDIIAALQAKQGAKNQQKFWSKCQEDLETWFGTLLGERDLRIEINGSGFWLITRRGESSLRCALADLGAGVSEILMVLAYLRLHPDESFLVVIDEPEAHLHPGAVVELAKIISEHLKNHQLLITTHSTALIDAVTPTWRTFRIRRAAHHGTAIDVLDTTDTRLALLADLGVRPSQLFLARATLWVEGPSDVHYWTALLRSVDKSLVVGRDFAFVIYGGASSSHLDFGDDDDEDGDADAADRLVQVLSVSHRAVIICDRDRNEDQPDRVLVDRLASAAARLPQHARVETSSGREIENDVRPELLRRVLEEVRPKRLHKPALVQLRYGDYTLGVDEAFDDVVAKAATDQDGNALTKDQVERVKQRLEQMKHRIGARIGELALAEPEPVFREEVVQKAKVMVAWLLADPPAN